MASNGMDVYVKMPSGRSAQFDVQPTLSIAGLCELVAKDEGVPQNHIRIKYQGKVLDRAKTVGWYGVRVETILKVEILIPKSLDLVVKLPEDIDDEVVISNLEPVSALFDVISGKLDQPAHKLQLEIAGKSLTSSKTSLMDAGVVGGSTVTVAIKKDASKVTGAAPVKMDEDAKQEVLSSFDAQGLNVEVVFSFDTTGSMYSYLTEVRSKLKECCRQLLHQIPNIRIGILAHGDYCDEDIYVIKQKDLTSDLESLVEFTSTVGTTTGGDCPECYEWVLRKAQHLDWSEDSAKALVVIGDLYPHPPSYTDQAIHWREELSVLTGMGVKVYGVQAGVNHSAIHFYKELSNVSGGCYVKLSHIDVITDMFLAVCYRESDEAMLDNFEEEVEKRGEMTEAKKEMFTHLKKKTEESKVEKKEKQPKNKVNLSEDWWDISNDDGRVQYKYNSNTDKWSRAGVTESQVALETRSERRPARGASFKKRMGKKCLIM